MDLCPVQRAGIFLFVGAVESLLSFFPAGGLGPTARRLHEPSRGRLWPADAFPDRVARVACAAGVVEALAGSARVVPFTAAVDLRSAVELRLHSLADSQALFESLVRLGLHGLEPEAVPPDARFEEQPAQQSYLIALVRSGLPPTTTPRKKVIVIGAGMAGLTAAYELQRAGHEPVVLEAQQRVGGRVCTWREPFSDGLYAEAGAMRIPRAHDLTMAYLEKFQVPTSPFTMGNPNAFYHLHGKRMRIGEATANPDLLGFEVAPNERGKTAAQLWQQALKPITAKR